MSEEEIKSNSDLNERRSPFRLPDDEIFNLSKTAIQVAKNENPTDFASHLDEIDRIDRIAEKQSKSKNLTNDERIRHLKEYFAMKQIVDSFDELTGVMDRKTIKRQISETLNNKPIDGKNHIYIDLDINNLKVLNEKGIRTHLSADEALKGFASFHMGKLAEKFGYRAKMGRLSGDEFAVIISDSTPLEVDSFFEEIESDRQVFMDKIKEKEGFPIDITAMRSVVVTGPSDTFDSIHEKADKALMEQKVERNKKLLEQLKVEKV